MSTNYQVTQEQAEALMDEAYERRKQRGGGRLDASEVLREIVDEWRTARGK
ncbi:hypothetical protein [Myxococcus llanfairpwllgwyngyllgogerychwyrndrobwllllantysiliogogogochensis]|uniref:hypothetical protein n=1 Tax=Myxococcus llanfairpwllgwyngyllgogerychwyrndrobwllllantysiliogogogochensis TaxID=2590453 RepID=UPI0015F10F11|nr:hypothetical protein [Myxococcus llanfairpwllgwyngyllgogerychwyrndrobwllllantysiliogogogochensis]